MSYKSPIKFKVSRFRTRSFKWGVREELHFDGGENGKDLYRVNWYRFLDWWDNFKITYPEMLDRYYFWMTGGFRSGKFSSWDLDIVLTPKFFIFSELNTETLGTLREDLVAIKKSGLDHRNERGWVTYGHLNPSGEPFPEPFMIDVWYSEEWEPWKDDLVTFGEIEAYGNQPVYGYTVFNFIEQNGEVTHDYSTMEPPPDELIQDLFKRQGKRMSKKHKDRYIQVGKFWKEPTMLNVSGETQQPVLPNIPVENCNKKELFVPLKDSLQIKNIKAIPKTKNKNKSFRKNNFQASRKNSRNLVHRDGIIGQCINKNKLKNNKITELIHNAETKLTRFQSKNTTKDNNMNMMDSDKNPVTGEKLFTSGFEFKTIIAGEMYSPGNLLWEEYKGEYHTHQNGEICAGPHDEMKIIKRRLLVRLTESKGENQ